MEDVIRIGHSRSVPIIVDAAGQVYPTENLSKYVKMGADLVAYGAKYFGSVNSSGLLTGREDLVSIAHTHSSIGFESTPVKSFGQLHHLLLCLRARGGCRLPPSVPVSHSRRRKLSRRLRPNTYAHVRTTHAYTHPYAV